jgi:hypothetical protein
MSKEHFNINNLAGMLMGYRGTQGEPGSLYSLRLSVVLSDPLKTISVNNLLYSAFALITVKE